MFVENLGMQEWIWRDLKTERTDTEHGTQSQSWSVDGGKPRAKPSRVLDGCADDGRSPSNPRPKFNTGSSLHLYLKHIKIICSHQSKDHLKMEKSSLTLILFLPADLGLIDFSFQMHLNDSTSSELERPLGDWFGYVYLLGLQDNSLSMMLFSARTPVART